MKVWQAGGNVLDSGQVRAAARITPNTWAPPKTAVWSNTIHSNQDSIPCHCEGPVLPANLYNRLYFKTFPAQQLPSLYLQRLRFSTKRTFLLVVTRIILWIWEHPRSSQTRFPGWAAPAALTWYRSCLYVSETDPQSWSSTPYGTAPLFLDHWIVLTGRFWTQSEPCTPPPTLETNPSELPRGPNPSFPRTRAYPVQLMRSWRCSCSPQRRWWGRRRWCRRGWPVGSAGTPAGGSGTPSSPPPPAPPPPTSPSASPSQRRGGIRAEPERGPPRYAAIQSALINRPATNR